MKGFKFTQTKEELQALLNDVGTQKSELSALVEKAEQLKEDLTGLRDELVALRGDNNTTPKIDCQKDVDNFLDGYTDKQTLNEVIGGTIDEDNEELIMN